MFEWYELMNDLIELSDETITLIYKIDTKLPVGLSRKIAPIEKRNLLQILKGLDTEKKPNRFLLESLRASLLKDLRNSFLKEKENESDLKEKENESENLPKNTSFFKKLKFWILLIGGTILALCEGYDGIVAFLPLLGMPVWISQIVLVVFSLLAVIAFYAFELGQISGEIGVKLPEARRLLDVLVDQAKEINLIRKQIKNKCEKENEKEFLSEMLDTLIDNQTKLNQLKKEFNDGLNKPYLHAAKIVATVLTGVIYFSGGFFASQIPVLSFLALLGITLAVTAWPVVIASILIGLAAVGVYWYVQRPAVDAFVCNIFGLDKDKINSLENCKTNVISKKESTGLDRLNEVKKEINLIEEKKEIHAQTPKLSIEPDSVVQVKKVIEENEEESAFMPEKKSNSSFYWQYDELYEFSPKCEIKVSNLKFFDQEARENNYPITRNLEPALQ